MPRERTLLHRTEGASQQQRQTDNEIRMVRQTIRSLQKFALATRSHRHPYDPERLGNPELRRARKERYLRRQAEQLGFTLTPLAEEVS